MADTKASAFTATTALTDDDTIPVIEDQDGTPLNRQITWANFKAQMSGRLIALVHYEPGTATAYTTTTTMSDVDATNLAVTFTAPPSGNVLIRLTCQAYPNTSTGNLYWSLREGSTEVVTMAMVASELNQFDIVTLSRTFRKTGLTAGSSYTYKWAASHQTNSWDLRYGGTAATYAGAATMEVVAAP